MFSTSFKDVGCLGYLSLLPVGLVIFALLGGAFAAGRFSRDLFLPAQTEEQP